MGLPSGLLWASANVGAASPADSGMYFSWGNTEGHAEGSDYDFSQSVYDATPAAEINTNLSLSQDAARANLGGLWRMPTNAEFQELNDNCTSVWTTMNGVRGCLFTSNVNGHTLFFPAAGGYDGLSLQNRGTRGNYWTSSWLSAADARFYYVDSSGSVAQSSTRRRYGFSVRAVLQSS